VAYEDGPDRDTRRRNRRLVVILLIAVGAFLTWALMFLHRHGIQPEQKFH
jgi:hypothetical protein